MTSYTYMQQAHMCQSQSGSAQGRLPRCSRVQRVAPRSEGERGFAHGWGWVETLEQSLHSPTVLCRLTQTGRRQPAPGSSQGVAGSCEDRLLCSGLTGQR